MKLIVGQYIPSNTFIHKLDPRVKILCNILFIVIIFISKYYISSLSLLLFIMFIFLLAKIELKRFISLLKPALFLLFFLFLINLFLIKVPANYPNWHYSWKVFQISYKTIHRSLTIFIRVYSMIIITTILISTTKPLDLTRGIEDLMYPLKWIKFPVHIIAMIISIALRFIPTLLIEANRIMQAQASRGVDFKNGNFKAKIKSTITLIIPLFVIAFGKAEDLSNAMETRGYDPYAKRTRYHVYIPRIKDYISLSLIIGVFTLLIFISYGGIPLPIWWV